MQLRTRVRWFILSALVFLMAQPAWASLSIQPAIVEADLGQETLSEAITVTNATDEVGRYRADVLHFIYTDRGEVRPVAPDAHSLAYWIKLNPKEFMLGPHGSRIVRMAVIPPRNAAPGEYWAAVKFQPLVGRISHTADANGRALTLEVVSSVLLPVIGHVGKLKYNCDIKDLRAWKSESGVQIAAVLSNTGTARVHMKSDFEIVSRAGTVVSSGPIGEGTILAGGERVFERLVKVDSGTGADSVRVRSVCEKLDHDIVGKAPVGAKSPDPAIAQPH